MPVRPFPAPEIPKDMVQHYIGDLDKPRPAGENQSGWGLKLLSSLCFYAAKQIRKA